MKLCITILLSLTLSALAFAQPHHPGGIETNGGNAYAADFFSILDNLLGLLEKKILPEQSSIIVNKIRAQRYRLTVRSQAQVFLQDFEVSAINQPSLELVVLSESVWTNLTVEQKTLLVLHEVLPIAGYQDKNYNLSSSLLTLLNTEDSEADQIKDLIGLCQKYRIINFELLLRKRTDLSYLIHLAALRGCHDFIESATKSGWNIDACWDEMTAYQRLAKSVDVLLPAEMKDRLKTAQLLKQLGANEKLSCK